LPNAYNPEPQSVVLQHWFTPYKTGEELVVKVENAAAVGFGVMSCSRIFHFYEVVNITDEELQNLGLHSTLRAFEQGGIFSCLTCCNTGPVFPVSSEGPPHSVASYDTQWRVEDLFLAGSSQVGVSSRQFLIKTGRIVNKLKISTPLRGCTRYRLVLWITEKKPEKSRSYGHRCSTPQCWNRIWTH
jgi:hypothetical protein